jgi:hypothetical protein
MKSGNQGGLPPDSSDKAAGSDKAGSDKARSRAGAGAPAGSTDESIGRPAGWREGRYQRSGAPVDQSVTPPASSRANRPKPPPAGQSKPVTLRDYEKK